MFIPIDYEQWDRKEIYDAFHGYLYCMTVELDITEFLKKIHENHWKFYPSMCYCIAKTVNGHQDYRYAKINGQVGYFDQVNPHYTLLRTNSNHLFTHQWTDYSEDFAAFHKQFLEDKVLGEACETLYYPKEDDLNNVHISIMPNTTYTALSYSKPDSFTHYNTPYRQLRPLRHDWKIS